MKALLSVLVMLGLVGVPAFANDNTGENKMEKAAQEAGSMAKEATETMKKEGKEVKKAAKKATKATKKEWDKTKKAVEEKTEGAMQEEGAM